MASKTVAQLEQENRELKAKLAQTAGQEDLAKENEQLKQQLATTKAHTKESEERLLQQIANLENVEISNGVVVGTHIKVMTPSEYAEYSKQNGRVMGRLEGTKTKCTIEELRALINSDWTPKKIMEKHGLDAEDFKQLVWALSINERRDKPIGYDLTTNRFFN